MAKRKRLAPAQSLERARDPNERAPETKSMGALSPQTGAPIASVAGDASTRAALDELSETLRRARAEGRMIIDLPLEQIIEDHLVRDRIAVDDEDMEALRASLKARGQQTPIEVVDLGATRFGLISGWRRLQALRAIGAESVKAIITPPREAPDAYVAMIEENEVRVGLSYFERARIVVKAVQTGVFETEKKALQALFASASRTKRSKIKSFIPVADRLGAALSFPTQMGERMGLQLSKALSDDPDAERRILAALDAQDCPDAEAEQAVLIQSLKSHLDSKKTKQKPPAPRHVTPVTGVTLTSSANSITLQGPRVDPKLYADLLIWLKGRS